MTIDKAQEELAFIKGIIEESREKAEDNGVQFIMWGIIVVIGMFANYFTSTNEMGQYLGYIWGGLILTGWFISFIMSRKEKKVCKNSFVDKIISSLWISNGISMTIIGFASGFQFMFKTSIISPLAICPVISVMLGISYFVTGTAMKLPWVSRLAFGWWIGGAFLFFFHQLESFFVFAAMITMFQIIPGIIIHKNKLKRA